MAWEMVKLGDIAVIKKGKKVTSVIDLREADSLRYIQIDDLRNDDNLKFCRPEKGQVAASTTDIVIAWDGANAGITSTNLTGVIGSTLAIIRFQNKKFEHKFLNFYFKSKEQFLRDTSTGATIPHMSRQVLDTLEIPLPPLPEQQRIATLLEKVDYLRQLRQQALRRLDDLVQATFLEMFGDPVTNPKGWETELLSHIALVRSGVTKGRKLSLEEVVSVPYMRVANVQDGYLNLDEIKNISVLPSDVEKYALQSGDLLLTEGGDLDKLGRGAIWKSQIEPCIHQNHIFCVRLETEEVRPEYLSSLVGSAYGKRYFLKQAKQTTGIASINSTQLKAFPVQKPSLSLQLSYEAAINQIKTQKHSHQTALTQLDTLFNALMQQAFTGQLQWNSDTVAQAQEQLRLPLPL